MSWRLQPPRVGQNIFFGQSSNFSGSGKKMKNNILNIINEKYEKYSIGYSKIKCPKFEHFGVRHSFFGRCPIFFGQNRSSPLQKMARTPMRITFYSVWWGIETEICSNLQPSLPAK